MSPPVPSPPPTSSCKRYRPICNDRCFSPYIRRTGCQIERVFVGATSLVALFFALNLLPSCELRDSTPRVDTPVGVRCVERFRYPSGQADNRVALERAQRQQRRGKVAH